MIIQPQVGRRKKRKPTKVERDLAASEQDLLDKWAKVPKFARTDKPPQVQVVKAAPPMVVNRKRAIYMAGELTPLNTSPQYTGDKMLGVGTMHKSNSVPVFSAEDAEAIAKMRR